jgi:N-acetylglucosaminyldiphosphoundecaprenol N-acetyl-beta-D-mannosaminyltransferase
MKLDAGATAGIDRADQTSAGRFPIASSSPAGDPVGRRPLGDRAEVLGCRIDRVDLEEALAMCEEAIRRGRFTQHMAINVAKLMAMRSNQELRRGIERCELVTADGQPVVWASRLLGDPLPMRVAGIDLMQALLARAAVKGYRVYILGARREILILAVAHIRARYPGISMVGFRDGYYADEEEAAVAEAIAESRADILFVAMSSPRKEYFLMRHGPTLGVPFVMGVGGAIDVLAGVTRRAPVTLQRTGLEWLFRLAQEPRRLGRRYLTTNTRFLVLVSRELGHGYRVRRPARSAATSVTTARRSRLRRRWPAVRASSSTGSVKPADDRRSIGRATR